MFKVTYDLLTKYIAAYLGNRTLNDKNIDLIAKFYAYAFTDISIDYIKSGAAEPPQEMADKLFDIAEQGMISAINNMLKKE